VARHGDIEMLNWTIEKGCVPNPDVTIEALKSENDQIFKWCTKQPWSELSERLFEAAASNATPDNMIYLKSIGCPVSKRAVIHAASAGSIENIKWLMNDNDDWKHNDRYNDIVRHAVINGYLHVIKWYIKNKLPWSVDLARMAAMYDQNDILKWIVNRRKHVNDTCTLELANNGNIPMLEWMVRRRFRLHPKCYESAIRNDNVPLLEWLLRNKIHMKRQKISVAIPPIYKEITEWITMNDTHELHPEQTIYNDIDVE
jgi:hypothetical protein